MKRFKKVYILLGVLAVACAATLGVTHIEQRKEQIRNSDEIILELPGESVQSLSWEYGDTSLAFHRDETWLYDGDEAFPVDEEKINALLAQFQAFGVSFIIEEVEDYGQYGLDEPVCTIRLSTEEQSYEIRLGDFSQMDEQRYVDIGDGNVYLVRNDPLDQFDAALSDMIDHDEIPGLSGATEIRFSGAQSYTILYEEDSAATYCADDVYFAQLGGSSLPLDTGRVKDYLSGITSLKLTNYVTYNATGEELHDWGLDEPELTVTVVCTTENEDGEEVSETFVLNVGLNREEKQAAEEAAAEGDSTSQTVTAYARVGESQIVYQISASKYEKLAAASYDDLRHRQVLTADFADIYRLDISLEGEVYTITSEEKDGERVYYYQDRELDPDELQDALEGLSANSFTDEAPTQKEEIGLTVYLDNENYPEIRVRLCRYSGDECLAEVDGETVSLIPRSQVVELIEAVHSIVLN